MKITSVFFYYGSYSYCQLNFAKYLQIIKADLNTTEKWILSKEGKLMAENGSHEANVFNSIPAEVGLPQSELQVNKISSFFYFCTVVLLWIYRSLYICIYIFVFH